MANLGSKIKQGNVSAIWRVGVPTIDGNGLPTSAYEDLSGINWACTIAVPTATPPISRSVTALSTDNTRFLAQLTPAETATMAPGTHTVAIEVTNPSTSPPFEVEEHVVLLVEAQLIS